MPHFSSLSGNRDLLVSLVSFDHPGGGDSYKSKNKEKERFPASEESGRTQFWRPWTSYCG